MKIVCEVSVINRLAPNVKSRPQQSTVAMGVHPPGSKDPEDIFIIHFSSANKNGTRYKVKRNIEQVFTKFLHDGKTTIAFKTPQHNLQIRCDSVQLKAFLQTLKLAMEGKFEPQKIGLSTLAVTAVPRASMPVKKMMILKPSEYPVKGLPRTLTHLGICGLRKQSIESQVLNLVNLTVLQLNNNCIARIPKRLGDMSLVELDLSQNSLGASRSSSDWSWAEGSSLRLSLQSLNLSDNKLTYFPYKLVKLGRLYGLKMDKNQISHVPFAIRRLKNLRDLSLANNQVSSLPSTFFGMKFDTLDLSGEEMLLENLKRHEVRQERTGPVERQPATLWQMAAQSVISKKIPYTSRILPWDVIELIEEAPFCDCGRICLAPIYCLRTRCVPLMPRPIHYKFTHNSGGLYRDAVFCSESCKLLFYTSFYQ